MLRSAYQRYLNDYLINGREAEYDFKLMDSLKNNIKHLENIKKILSK